MLSNSRQRELYDLSLHSSSSTVHAAANEGARQTGPTGNEIQGEWVPGAGWFAWATRPASQPKAGQVDKLRAELRTEFRAALRHAYLGPRVDVSFGELPEAFEGEERSVPGVSDVLQLVSGRQLLGVVRQRQDAHLTGAAGRIGQEHLRHLDSGARPSQQSSCHPSCSHSSSASADSDLASQQLQSEASQAAAAISPVLELVLRGQPIAVALKQRNQPKQGLSTEPTSASDHSAQQHRQRQAQSNAEQSSAEGNESGCNSAEPWTCIYAMDGSVLAAAHEDKLYKNGAAGPHTHTILSGQTPLVRHLHIVSNPQGGQELSICRCRRAWLPPSSTWLFPPRSQDHASGGWYFEWGGHVFHRHPTWLHPAVMVLLAAFETLTHEAQAQPAVTELAGDRASAQPSSKAQQVKQWLSSMLHFHKRPR